MLQQRNFPEVWDIHWDEGCKGRLPCTSRAALLVPSPPVQVRLRVQVGANPEFPSLPHDRVTEGWQDDGHLRS